MAPMRGCLRSPAGLLLLALLLSTPRLVLAQTEGDAAAGDAGGDEDYDPRAVRTEGIDDAAAQSRFRIGQAFFDEGRFLEAAQEWESAYELSQRPSLLFNAYLAYREAGRLADAVRSLDAYLTEGNSADHDRLMRVLAAMRQTLEQTEAERAAAAEREAALAAEREAAQRAADEQRARADEAHRRASASENRTVGWVVLGAGGGGLLLGGVAASIFASTAATELEDSCPNDRCIVGFDREGTQDRAKSAALAADILFAGAGVAVVTGIVLLLVGPGSDAAEEPAEAGDVEPSAMCGPTGCSLGLNGVF